MKFQALELNLKLTLRPSYDSYGFSIDLNAKLISYHM